MKITYPKDTPQWLMDLIEALGNDVQNNVISTPPDLFLAVRGETKLYRRICEEIDALGLSEIAREKEITTNATRRE